MIWPEGRTGLAEVWLWVDELTQATFSDSDIRRFFPHMNFPDEASTRRMLSWMSETLFNSILEECGSLAVTSNKGTTLCISSVILERGSLYPGAKAALGFSSNELGLIFIHPTHFFVTLALWENLAAKVFEANLDPEEFELFSSFAHRLRDFEGWGLSIITKDVPRNEEQIQQAAKIWSVGKPDVLNNTEKVGRPPRIPKIAERLRVLYPDRSLRPPWKNIQRALKDKGEEASERTIQRAWETIPDKTP